MKMQISRIVRQQLLDWAREAGPNECCGLIFGDYSGVDGVQRARNVASDPAVEFEIDPAVLIAAERAARSAGPPILGYFHSHPSGLAGPSVKDAEMASADGRLWFIIAQDDVTVWRPVAHAEGGCVSFARIAIDQG